MIEKVNEEMRKEELVLLLGEGNFSFAIQLAPLLPPTHQLVATDFHPNLTFDLLATMDHLCEASFDPVIRANVEILLKQNIPVWLRVDATRLHENEALLRMIRHFSTVYFVFNFPHVKTTKMKIDLNRRLVANTFDAIRTLCSKLPGGVRIKVFISLCHGQSGLNQVELEGKHRVWGDSWQITEMAAFGDFILTQVQPFCLESWTKLFTEPLPFSTSSSSSFSTSFSSFFPYGYRLRNQTFASTSPKADHFQGGNIFAFTPRPFHRELECDPLNQPLVQRIIQELTELLQSSSASKIEKFNSRSTRNYTHFPLNYHVIAFQCSNCDIFEKEDELRRILSNYLRSEVNVEGGEIRNGQVRIGSFEYPNTIRIILETVCQLKLDLEDIRILYSPHLDAVRSLHPQTFKRDFAFWYERSFTSKHSNFDHQDLVNLVLEVFGVTLIRSIQLLEVLIARIEPRWKVSYTFRFTIESVDAALDRTKVHRLMTKLTDEVNQRMVGATVR